MILNGITGPNTISTSMSKTTVHQCFMSTNVAVGVGVVGGKRRGEMGREEGGGREEGVYLVERVKVKNLAIAGEVKRG